MMLPTISVAPSTKSSVAVTLTSPIDIELTMDDLVREGLWHG